jgi:hypothetical protein
MSSDSAEIRRQQRRAENAARPRPVTQVVRIGDRANNGRYNVTQPDGGMATGKAIKSFDAAHQPGQVVGAIGRKDGAIVLSGPKAFREPTAKENPLDLAALVDRCDGYLNGQIFNCGVEKRVLTIAWAIGRTPGFGGALNYNLLNLLTGESFGLGVAPPATVPPCAPPPPNTPQTPPPNPVDPSDDKIYLHVWQNWDWGTPIGPVCSPFPTSHPNSTGATSSSTINLQSTIDNANWTYRYEAGGISGGGLWSSFALSIYTNNPTPPPIGAGVFDYAVVSNASGYTFVNNFLQIGGSGSNWTYMAAGCPPVNITLTPSPPIDSRNLNGTPVPNTVEYSLSIGDDLGPIALIRHTPNCVSPGVWNSEKSYTIKADANGTPQIKVTNGKLNTDWRYGQTFPCRDTFKPQQFVNISGDDRTKMWSIETADRPATLTPNDPNPTPIKITEKAIDPTNNCATTPGKTKDITPIVSGNLPFEIVAIAVKIVKRG